MQFSELYKKRALELYGEYTAKEVFQHLADDFPNKQHPNERTLRRWRNAREAEKNRREQGLSASENRKEHFRHLVEIIFLILSGGLDRISNIHVAGQYEIIEEGYTIRTLSRDQLIAVLEENLAKTYQKYADWQVDGQLLTHIEAEYPKFKDVWGYINESPMEVVDILRTLVQRKTFKGTCPVCRDWH